MMGLGASGCSLPSPPQLTERAYFSDVGELQVGAPVKYLGVQVGSVKYVGLAGDRAEVTFTVDRKARVPADVVAIVRPSTLLGETIIELEPRGKGRAELLGDHQVLSRTEYMPGLQQLVETGSGFFGALSSQELSELVRTGAESIGSSSGEISSLIRSLDEIVSGYDEHSAQIASLVASLHQLGSDLAPDSQANAELITRLSEVTGTLSDNSGRLVALLKSLDQLATSVRGLVEGRIPEVKAELTDLAEVLSTLDGNLQTLDSLLATAPGIGDLFSAADSSGQIQVLSSLIVCGVPGVSPGPSAGALSCQGRGGGQ
jgi:phospholipid/cholesterol/gamma-HCH transport system substrate-binding protein